MTVAHPFSGRCQRQNEIKQLQWNNRNRFVANFVSWTKYYLNWFSFHIVIVEVIRLSFFETRCSLCECY